MSKGYDKLITYKAMFSSGGGGGGGWGGGWVAPRCKAAQFYFVTELIWQVNTLEDIRRRNVDGNTSNSFPSNSLFLVIVIDF